jgi:hypothetical protein
MQMARFVGCLGRAALFIGLLAILGWPTTLAVMTPHSPATPPQPEVQAQVAPVRRVNAPYDVPGEQAAIFWFGQVTPTENSVDVRVGYKSQYLYVHVTVFDRRLWYDETPSPDTLTDWDAVSLYVNTDGTTGDTPSPNSYRFDAQLVWWEPRDDYQAAYRGNGSDWIEATLPFTTTSFWRGEMPNDSTDDRGWAATYYVPFSSLGEAQAPSSLNTWGMGLAAHDCDALSGTPIADQVWPETMDPEKPATWGQLAFGMPEYTPPPSIPSGTVTIRHGLDGAVVPDADVGGSSVCGELAAPDFFPTWGDLNYAGKDFVNIQNQSDVADWPCFSRYYVTFPLDALPAQQVVLSATLTLYQFGNAGEGWDPGPQPSLIQVLTVGEDWDEATLTWNNAPLAQENVSAAWAEPLPSLPPLPGVPRRWDVSQAAAQAHNEGIPLRLALYESDWDYHSGKYFYSSDQDEWNALGRPTLTIALGSRIPGLEKTVTPMWGYQNEPTVYTVRLAGTGRLLSLSDALPSGVSAPQGLSIEGSSVLPIYDAQLHRITWQDAPGTGQEVSIDYATTITMPESEALANVAELLEEGGTTSTVTATVLANPHRTYLPLVCK